MLPNVNPTSCAIAKLYLILHMYLGFGEYPFSLLDGPLKDVMKYDPLYPI